MDLGSPDPDAAADFYSDLFGWEIGEAGPPESGGYRLCMLRGIPVAGLGIQEQPDIAPYWTTYVSVADVDSTVKEVRGAGGQVMVEVMDVMDAGRMAVLADPSGAVFCAWQPLTHIGAGLVDEPGTLSWNELLTRDLDGSKAFYGTIFGWTANTMQLGEMAYTEWKLGGASMGGMMEMDATFPAEVPPHWMVYFAVADTDATVEKVVALGGHVHQPPMDIPQGRFALVADPQGALFSVIALAHAAG
ncbi:VOC family protein [Fodinicola feengrottensis]|uniref:VOC family protein n=1 Tax=Fodinicola feengrottensis TaxID=435914 RepID=UPI0013D5435D|nr:VOC family protein [Fodinicola feengrottensis]